MIILSHVMRQHASLPNFDATLLDPHEDAIDLTTATSVVLRAQLLGDSTTTFGGACTIVEAGSGEVSYAFQSSDTQISGQYLATIQITFPGGKVQSLPFNDYYLIVVEPDLADDAQDPDLDLVFATVANARAMGYEVTGQQLLRAQGHIELMSGRMIEDLQEAIENNRIPRSDIARLKKATVYQAVWLDSNDDAEARTDVTDVKTAGLSGEAATLTADGVILAPMARRLITGLSWVRSRSIRTTVGNARGRASLTTTNGTGWVAM